jgi:hypothetical protein
MDEAGAGLLDRAGSNGIARWGCAPAARTRTILVRRSNQNGAQLRTVRGYDLTVGGRSGALCSARLRATLFPTHHSKGGSWKNPIGRCGSKSDPSSPG